jgi:hypothetical protein
VENNQPPTVRRRFPAGKERRTTKALADREVTVSWSMHERMAEAGLNNSEIAAKRHCSLAELAETCQLEDLEPARARGVGQLNIRSFN